MTPEQVEQDRQKRQESFLFAYDLICKLYQFTIDVSLSFNPMQIAPAVRLLDTKPKEKQDVNNEATPNVGSTEESTPSRDSSN